MSADDGEFGEYLALSWAVDAASNAGCEKSQRGVVVWMPGEDRPRSLGWNHQPGGFKCDGSQACRADCNKLCVHAEAHALLGITAHASGLHMLHVKTVDGAAVPSGPPSCWQCSRLILAHGGIEAMWLLHEIDGERVLVRYSPVAFHHRTLHHLHLGGR